MTKKIMKQWSVDEKLLEDLRSKFLEDVDESRTDQYHNADITRVKEDDWFIARYLLHQRNNVDAAVNMMKESLKWRMEFGVNDMKESDILPMYFEKGNVFISNKDIDGNVIVVVQTRFHVNDPENINHQQRYLIHWIEKAIRQNDWGTVTMLFDCTKSGISNMDMEQMKFIVSLFKKSYPWALGYFLVYNMPWFFAAAWKIIRGWIPKEYSAKIQFVSKASIKNYILESQLPVDMGGAPDPEDVYDPARDEDKSEITEQSPAVVTN